MRIPLLTFFISFPYLFLYSQSKAQVSGTILDSKSAQPLSSVVVTLQNTVWMQLTNSNGNFAIEVDEAGDYLLSAHSQGYKDVLLSIVIAKGEHLQLGSLALEEDIITDQQSNTIRLLDEEVQDDNGSSENTSVLLQSTKDAFQQAAAFNWGAARFRMRGLDSEQATTLINGIKMNKVYDGRPQWGNWGGLNDVTRNQELTIGTAASDYSFGGVLGAQEINTRASIYRKGTRITFSGTNTNYNWRTIVTHASGLQSNGWAYIISAGKRWADEGYFDGTTYDGNSVFIGVEKKLNDQHSINFSGFYTPNSRGKNSPNTDEVLQLTPKNYNSYWGLLDGKQRNARVKTVEEPILMLNHYFNINDHSNLQSSIMYQTGKVSNSNIDYQNANSPDPTYYRKLPSYYLSLYAPDQGENSGAFTPDLENAEKSRLQFLENPQIDWNGMYRANQSPVFDASGKVTSYVPAQSHYVLYEDRTDDTTVTANSLFDTQINDNVIMNAGGSFSQLKSHNYQKLIDLLGGAFFEDFDPYYKGTHAQSDLNNPNRKVMKGEAYGYNFNYLTQIYDAFTQFKFTYKTVDFYLAQSFSNTLYQREGLYKNGIYETNSYGKSEQLKFENFGFKGGMLFKLSGKQSVTLNGAHLTKAPSLKSSFPNSRISNVVIPSLESETINSVDASYYYRSPKLKTRLTIYTVLQENATQTSFFYAEGIFDNGAGYTSTNAFVEQTLTHLNKRNQGLEWSMEYNINATLKATFAAAYGQYVYANNPNVTISNDALATVVNPNPVIDFGTALLKNYKLAGMPQQAYSFGMEYRDPHYWWLASNINFLDARYVDISPIARTSRFYTNPASGFVFPEATEETAKILLAQEKLDSVALLNVIGGKSWHIHKKYLGLFFSINNVLDTAYKTGGYEQARNANFRQRNQDLASNAPSFANKYFQGYGRTYYVNLNFSL
ncbi:carboxypeptidase-like regulatory domain-containing protein [Flavobacterium algicola]|uniref:carboxypeptidase-like regulatory domain-containing protein n=1 Tax=Flavobacterium algicola TaxID=556529 RepID=UPI001EFD7716|nr:carboxypeptidase-like regulatory domain-containing protein [Flavobacterium algicola]MCG9792068.1 TonB-dependent receptor [Flavobacterium algicola]